MQCVAVPAELVRFFHAQGIHIVSGGSFAICQPSIDPYQFVNVADAMVSGAAFAVDTIAKLEGIYAGLHHSVVSSEDKIHPTILANIAKDKQIEYERRTKEIIARIYHAHTSSPNGDLRILIEDIIYESAKLTVDRIEAHRKSRPQQSPYKAGGVEPTN